MTGSRRPVPLGAGELLAALAAAVEGEPGRAAEVYAALGYPVLPVWPPRPDGGCACPRAGSCPWPGKHPLSALVPHGLKDATADPATVRAWWRAWPGASVALRTGPGSFDACDVDGPEGVEALRAVLPTADVTPTPPLVGGPPPIGQGLSVPQQRDPRIGHVPDVPDVPVPGGPDASAQASAQGQMPSAMTSANPQTDHGSGGSDAAVPGSTGRHDEATSSPTAEHPASVLGAGPHAAGSADVRAAQRRPEILEADSRPPLARTGGGGWHLLFRPTGLGNRVRMLPGVDWRGTGGLIVVWPSLHASGQRYTWTRPLTLAAELPQVPPPLRRLLAPPVAASQPPPRGDAPIRTASAYAARALADECATVEATSPGGRNHAVNRAAFKLARLVAARALTEASATAALTDAAAAAGLGPVEAGQAIRSGLKAGQDPARNRALARQAATTRYRPGRKGGAR